MRRAFTLIELVVVMIIMGTLASMVVYSLGGTIDRHRMSQAVETIEIFDARARRTARTLRGAVNARIDRSEGKLSVNADRPGHDVSFRLPSRVEITEIRFGSKQLRGRETGFRVSAQGRSASYAVQLQRGKLTKWLVVLGFSGQVVTMDKEGEVNAILSN